MRVLRAGECCGSGKVPTLPKFCRKNVYYPSLTSSVQSGASRAHLEWSFYLSVSPPPILFTPCLCAWGSACLLCFPCHAVPIIRQSLFHLHLLMGVTPSWDNAVILGHLLLLFGPPAKPGWSRSLNSIITN